MLNTKSSNLSKEDIEAIEKYTKEKTTKGREIYLRFLIFFDIFIIF